MDNTNKTSLQKALDNLINEIKELAEEHSETDLDQLLADQIGPALAKEEQVYGTSVFAFLHVAVSLHDLESNQKALSVESALNKVTDKHLLEYADCTDVVKRFILGKEPVSSDVAKQYEWNEALKSALKLESHVSNELYYRVQGYGNDIKKLKEAS